ncbi:MAG TPA: HisS family protein, partial [Hyphomicrobiaceae bacterium]|nr:HisS family protein [Hyphomicrobiaceae bacterium]
MAKPTRNSGPEARLPKGLRDVLPDELRATQRMLDTIRGVYESYGFEPLDTPAIEYTDALGKFLPDQDRPNEGVFSFQDEDEQWLSLRYDLTAPLARYVAEGLKEQRLSLPFRRYQVGPVWRNEKPGPGRFRQFMQFDADTVGTDNIAADAEICMLAADTLEALGLTGKYRIKVNSRKVLDGMLQSVGVDLSNDTQRLAVLRSLDKLDKFERSDVALLLGPGRKDESGDFTKGAGLSRNQADALLGFVTQPAPTLGEGGITARRIGGFEPSPLYVEGLGELQGIARLVQAAGYGPDRIGVDYSVVRGLEYYTGPVFEAELTFEVKNDDGQTVRFGSVGGGVLVGVDPRRLVVQVAAGEDAAHELQETHPAVDHQLQH